MSALDGAHILKERYYRDIRNAVVAAAGIHAAAFVAAPAYVPRPISMKASLLRVVNAVAPPFAIDAAHTTPTAAPLPEPAVGLTAGVVIRTEHATALPSPSSEGATQTTGELLSSGEAAGTPSEAVAPVFYAYDSPPQATRRVEPDYPAIARALGAEGAVVVNVNIDERGQIVRAWVAEASAPGVLIDAALEAVYRFEFSPGSQRGIPVKCTVAIPFLFSLKKTMQVKEGE